MATNEEEAQKQEQLILPMYMYGMVLKMYSNFFRRMILIDSEHMYSKHQRHYDYECEGLENLSDFLMRKLNKNLIVAFHSIKLIGMEEDDKQVEVERLKLQGHVNERKLHHHVKYEKHATTRTKPRTGINTSIEDSEGWAVSPNTVRNFNRNRTAEYINTGLNSSDNQDIYRQLNATDADLSDRDKEELIRRLFLKVKKANTEASQFNKSRLKPVESSYFNVTLGGGKSTQTFQYMPSHSRLRERQPNHQDCQCNCSCHEFVPMHTPNANRHAQESSQDPNFSARSRKRQMILDRFEDIQCRINTEDSTFTERKPIQPAVIGARYNGSNASRRHIDLSFDQDPAIEMEPVSVRYWAKDEQQPNVICDYDDEGRVGGFYNNVEDHYSDTGLSSANSAGSLNRINQQQVYEEISYQQPNPVGFQQRIPVYQQHFSSHQGSRYRHRPHQTTERLIYVQQLPSNELSYDAGCVLDVRSTLGHGPRRVRRRMSISKSMASINISERYQRSSANMGPSHFY